MEKIKENSAQRNHNVLTERICFAEDCGSEIGSERFEAHVETDGTQTSHRAEQYRDNNILLNSQQMNEMKLTEQI